MCVMFVYCCIILFMLCCVICLLFVTQLASGDAREHQPYEELIMLAERLGWLKMPYIALT